jgi:hypothetical protein
MSRKIAFIEIPEFSGVVPLVSGYMEACCLKDPLLAASFTYKKLLLAVKPPYEQIISTLQSSNANVYAFSRYVWNTGLVRRLLSALLKARPQSHFILGGPQVMAQGARYLFMRSKSLHEHFMYCHDMSQRMPATLPIWQETHSNL